MIVKTSIQLGERAALGELQAFEAIEALVGSQINEAKNKCTILASALRRGKSLPPDLYRDALTTIRACRQLGALDLAEVLLALIKPGDSHAAQRWFSFEIEADQSRKYTLLRLDGVIKSQLRATRCESGDLPGRINIEQGVSYVIQVETGAYEPTVCVPIYVDTGEESPKSLRIDLAMWQGFGPEFTWMPRVTCTVGGDLAARDPLMEGPVTVGPLIVSRRHVRMREYLEMLARREELTVNSRYSPSYMGTSLVEYVGSSWIGSHLPLREQVQWSEVPVVGVDLECSEWFCSCYPVDNSLSCGLLSEVEWEVLARGPDMRLFPWGDVSVPGFANMRLDSALRDRGLEPVGSRETDVSSFGLFDCCGNAEEWCKLEISHHLFDKGFAVSRGGSWYNPEQAGRLASRVIRHSDYRHKKLTFRVAVRPGAADCASKVKVNPVDVA